MNIKMQNQQARESFVRRHRSFFVGLFVLIPLVVILGLLLYTLMKSEMLQKRVTLYTVYDQNPGLGKAASVSMSGMKIGDVKNVTLVREGVIAVEFRVDARYISLIRKNSRAVLAQKNFPVGDWEIQITGGADTAGIAAKGDTLRGDYSLRIDKMTAQVTGMMGKVDTIVGRIAAGKGTAGRILAEDTLIVQVQGILRNVNTITVQAVRMMKQADTLLAFMNRLGASGVTMVDTVAVIMATVQKSLKDATVIMDNVKGVSADLGPMMKEVRDNLDAADVMMRGLQKNWIVRKMTGTPEDRIIKDAP